MFIVTGMRQRKIPNRNQIGKQIPTWSQRTPLYNHFAVSLYDYMNDYI